MDKSFAPAELVLDHVQDGVVVFNKTTVLYCNDALAGMVGLTKTTILQAKPFDFVPAEDLARTVDRVTRRLAGEELPSQYELQLLHSNGIDRIPVLTSVGVIQQGAWRNALVATFKDLSAVRHAMTELEHRRGELERILEGLPDPYYRTDAQGKVLYCTSSAEQIFGLRPDQLIGHPMASFYATPEDRVKVLQAILDGNGAYVLVEARMRKSDGSVSWVSTRARAIFDAKGQFAGVEGSGRDISKRIEMEQTLREALNQLDAKERAKTGFLAAASHDLRQPIQAMQLFLFALQRSGLDSEQQTIASHVGEAVDSLSGLLEALLDVSRLDAGIIAARPVACDLGDILAHLNKELGPQARARGLRFNIWLPRTPLRTYTDRNLLSTILRNLATNALACVKRGGILVSARRRGDDALIQVWDTGIGIGEEHIARIFEEFYQIDNPERDRTKGLGLGLAIVKRIAGLLGTEISCRSTLGKGTLFSFRLPLYDSKRHGQSSGTIPNAPAAPPLSEFVGKRFLVVEDDEQLARSMDTWLRSLGAHVVRYPSAEAALAMHGLEATDYFIADFRLSGALHGLAFLDEAQRRLARPMKAVVITGDTAPEFLAMAEDSQWPVLFKPVAPDQLMAVLISGKKPQRRTV